MRFKSRMAGLLALALIGGLSAFAPSASAAPAPSAPAKVVVPPNLTAEEWAAKFPESAKSAHANEGLARAALAQMDKNRPFTPLVATGPRPWGGDYFAGFDLGFTRDGRACTAGANTMTSIGTRYVQTAGHCFLNANGVGPYLDPNTSEYWTPPPANQSVPPNIGNNGYGGAIFGGPQGDAGWIRANKAGLTFSEVNVYDSRGAVNYACACDPVVGEAASISAGHSGTLIRGGTIIAVNQTRPYSCGTNCVVQVGNQGLFRTDATHFGCPISGDSGSPIVGPNHEFLGTLTGGFIQTPWCYEGFDQARKSMQRVNQTLAPSDPSAP